MKGQPDIIIVNYHEICMYSEMCIDFQTPSNNYKITEAQLSLKKQYHRNRYKFIFPNDYDLIICKKNKYIQEIKIPRKYSIYKLETSKYYSVDKRYFHKTQKVINTRRNVMYSFKRIPQKRFKHIKI